MSAPQKSGSDLASTVLIPKRLAMWPKLDCDEPPAQLHAKFWGKSMVDEEQEWLRTQPAIGVGDERDDILPGCYVLDIGMDIGINGIDYSRIWVRAEYLRVYNELQNFYDVHVQAAEKKMWGPAPSAVLTGQPGIGEFPHNVT
jgi:hypothetical protein